MFLESRFVLSTVSFLLSLSGLQSCSVRYSIGNVWSSVNFSLDNSSIFNTEHPEKANEGAVLQTVLNILQERNQTEVEIINANFCGIQKVTALQFSGFHHLDFIDLGHNSISSLEEFAFYNLPVSNIHLRNNEMTIVVANTFVNLTNLDELDLGYNNITSLDEYAFCNLPVYKLYLDHNKLTTLAANAFVNLTALAELRLSQNSLMDIDKTAFVSLTTLYDIYLDDNSLKELPFQQLKKTKIEFIFAANNKIEKISANIADLRHLEKIDVQGNRITDVTKDMARLMNLKELLIENNTLTTLPFDLRYLFNNMLEMVGISGNPWHCDCDLLWLIEIVQFKRPSLTVKSPPRCAKPTDSLMMNVNLSCGPAIKTTPFNIAVLVVPTVVVFIVVILISSGIWFYRYRLRTKMRDITMIDSDQYIGGSVLWQGDVSEEVFTTDNLKNTMTVKSSLTRRLRLGRLIGRGAFGEVYEGFSSALDGSWKKVAVKKIKDNSSSGDRSGLETELNQLVEIGKHPNIIQLIGFGVIEGTLFIVMELAELGDLHAYLKALETNNQNYIDGLDIAEHKTYLLSKHPQLFIFMWSISKGMEYLSTLKIIHRDLAARNILLTSGPVAKLSDFGLARDLYESGYYYINSKGRLPYKWLSPETLTNGKCTMKSDVWSFGILLWEVTTLGGMPYPGIPPEMLLSIHKTGYIMPQPSMCPDRIYEIMAKCWRYDSNERPCFKCLVEEIDSFIQNGLDNHYIDMAEDENDQLLSEWMPETKL